MKEIRKMEVYFLVIYSYNHVKKDIIYVEIISRIILAEVNKLLLKGSVYS